MTRIKTGIVFLFLCITADAQSPAKGSHQRHADFVLDCRGVTYATTSLKKDGPHASTQEPNADLQITRYQKLLEVKLNFRKYSLPSATKPDAYRTGAETNEGFIAVYANSTNLKTLTIDKSLTHALLVESGFSFLEPQSEPISDTIFFTCTKE